MRAVCMHDFEVQTPIDGTLLEVDRSFGAEKTGLQTRNTKTKAVAKNAIEKQTRAAFMVITRALLGSKWRRLVTDK